MLKNKLWSLNQEAYCIKPSVFAVGSSLNAIKSLERSVATYNKLSKNISVTEEDLETIKSGVIQNFKVSYEQCWKYMKRWIEENVSPDLADGVTRKELYRVSAKNGLIVDVEEWMEFNKSRNSTSHTYNCDIADKVLRQAFLFIHVAK